MASAVQNDIAADLGKVFNRPINVSVIEKATKFPFLQELGFNGQLSFAKDTFHGLSDFKNQMQMFSSAMSPMSFAAAAWTIIRLLVPKNPFVSMLLFKSGSLGSVGSAFKKMVGFDQIFSVSMDELKTAGQAAITNKLSS